MKRREFLKLFGAVVLLPTLPIPAKQPSNVFIYRGYRFRREVRIFYDGAIHIYFSNGNYCIAHLVEPEVYPKCKNWICDRMIKRMVKNEAQRIS